MTLADPAPNESSQRKVSIRLRSVRPIVVTAPWHCHVMKVIERDGLRAYEPHSLVCALAAMQSREGDFYDVGANAGIYSIVVAAAHDRRCIAFEPTPDLAQGISESARAQYLPIQVRQIALGAERGTAKLYISSRSDASNSLNAEFRAHSGELDVAVETLDNAAQSRIAVIKIDTETTEPDVMRGGRSAIARDRPMIIVEILSRPGCREFVNAFLAESGYVAYHISSKDRWRAQLVVPEIDGSERNWLLTSKPLGVSFWDALDTWRWRLLG